MSIWMPISAVPNADAQVALGQDYGQLKNNWVRWSGGDTIPAYRLSGEAVVYMKGAVQGGAIDTVITTLPPWCTPPDRRGPLVVLARTSSAWALAAVEIVPRDVPGAGLVGDVIARWASGNPNVRFSLDTDFAI